MSNNIILSICIPTFNRADVLKYSLDQIVKATKDYQDLIEINISDNNSTDDTEYIVNQYIDQPNLFYYKNSVNIGFNLNIIKLIDYHATGKFCWIIGDDDFIDNESIPNVISVIQKNEDIDYIYTNYRLEYLDSIISEIEQGKRLNKNLLLTEKKGFLCIFDEIIAKEYRTSNLLLTYISSSIFRTALLKSINKDKIENDNYSIFYNTFPHSYFLAIAMKSKKSFFFENPLVSAGIHEKSSDYFYTIYMKCLPDLFDFYKKTGYSRSTLKNTNNILIRSGFSFLYKKSPNNTFSMKIRFFLRYMFCYQLYEIGLSMIFKEIKSRTKFLNQRKDR